MHPSIRKGLAASLAALLPTSVALADGIRFSDYTPLTASAGPTADESQPITFGNPAFVQRSVADRATQLAAGVPNTGAWDMITTNESGTDKGRYLFTVFETGQSGVQRLDRTTGQADTIWMALNPGDAASFDPSYWTPWGTFITGEENWGFAPGGLTTNFHGRLFELKNPLTATPIPLPLMPDSNDDAVFVHQNVIPRSAHEGIQFDKAGNLYFIDELNGGNIYRYTPAAKMSEVKNGSADYFAAGQTSVLRVGNGTTPNATGAFKWIPFTDWNGNALPGAITITDPHGVTSVDASNSTDVPAYKGTDYQRPEDMQLQRRCGGEFLYVTTTTTHEVYRLDLKAQKISLFASPATIDLATGLPAGAALRNPDNLAVDHHGNIYIVEDRNGAVDDDIWFANDLNRDGDLSDAGEGIGRWATNGTVGSEFTGLYFDPAHSNRAWVDIQHPSSGNDRTIEISIDDPTGTGDADPDLCTN